MAHLRSHYFSDLESNNTEELAYQKLMLEIIRQRFLSSIGAIICKDKTKMDPSILLHRLIFEADGDFISLVGQFLFSFQACQDLKNIKKSVVYLNKRFPATPFKIYDETQVKALIIEGKLEEYEIKPGEFPFVPVKTPFSYFSEEKTPDQRIQNMMFEHFQSEMNKPKRDIKKITRLLMCPALQIEEKKRSFFQRSITPSANAIYMGLALPTEAVRFLCFLPLLFSNKISPLMIAPFAAGFLGTRLMLYYETLGYWRTQRGSFRPGLAPILLFSMIASWANIFSWLELHEILRKKEVTDIIGNFFLHQSSNISREALVFLLGFLNTSVVFACADRNMSALHHSPEAEQLFRMIFTVGLEFARWMAPLLGKWMALSPAVSLTNVPLAYTGSHEIITTLSSVRQYSARLFHPRHSPDSESKSLLHVVPAESKHKRMAHATGQILSTLFIGIMAYVAEEPALIIATLMLLEYCRTLNLNTLRRANHGFILMPPPKIIPFLKEAKEPPRVENSERNVMKKRQ